MEIVGMVLVAINLTADNPPYIAVGLIFGGLFVAIVAYAVAFWEGI